MILNVCVCGCEQMHPGVLIHTPHANKHVHLCTHTCLLHPRGLHEILGPGGRPQKHVVVEVDELVGEPRDAVQVRLWVGCVCV